MSNNLNSLLNDEITDLVVFTVFHTAIESNDVYRIRITEEMIRCINSAVEFKNRSPELDSLTFSLNREVEAWILDTQSVDDQFYNQNAGKNISLDIFPNFSWKSIKDRKWRTNNHRIEIKFYNSKSGDKAVEIMLHFDALECGFFLDVDPAISQDLTFRECLKDFNLKISKWD